MLLRTLLDSPELRLRVLTGEEAMDRPIEGAFTTDLLDPRRYLSGGEIVLTGLMWRRTPDDSETFVSALAQAGVAALAAGDAALGWIPPDLVDACRRHRLLLIEVPVDVSFATITERVIRARSAGAGHFLQAVRRRLLTGVSASGAAAAAAQEPTADEVRMLLATADAEYGLACWVISPLGRVVVGPRPMRGARLPVGLAVGYLSAPRLPATMAVGDAAFSLFRIMGHPAHRLAGWFVAFVGDHAIWDEDRRTVATELTGVAAAHHACLEEGRRPARLAADDLLRQVLAWHPDAATAEQREVTMAMQRCGLSPRQRVVAVAAVLSGVSQAQPVARALLEEMLPGAAVGSYGAEVFALAPDTENGRDRIKAAVGTLRQGLPDIDLTLGVSASSAVVPGRDRSGGQEAQGGGRGAHGGELADTMMAAGVAASLSSVVEDARHAARIARLRGNGVRMVDSAELGSHLLLLAMVPEEARSSFCTRLLTPLVAYDREHGTELVRTLEVFLGCSGSWTRTAELMYVHVNTLRYRVRRIEELTRRDLGSLDDQVDLLLALRLRAQP